MSETPPRVPAIVNVASGSADEARQALAESGAFDVQEAQPEAITAMVKRLVAGGARRVLVAGGDGTISAAAAALVDTPTEMAVLPGGTLNHFARDLGISTVASEAVELASSSASRGVDVGAVNDHIFLNTSSVGAYVRFVRVRESLEKSFGYRIASAIAAFRILFTLRLMAVEVVVDGEKRIYRTPLVFIGVGERGLRLPGLGQRIRGGRSGLHVMVVHGRSRARWLALGLAAVARDTSATAHLPQFESFLVDELRIDMNGMGTVAVDGEIVNLSAPLHYELKRDALTVVVPSAESLLAHSSA